MRKSSFILVIIMGLLSFTCTKITPITDKIKKNWAVQIAKHSGTTVYTKGGSGNSVDYSGFRLNLTTAPNATLVALDKNTFTGQYEITGANTEQTTGVLTLKSLSPVPTGTGGVIEFTIISITETNLVLSRTSVDQKTGGTQNEFTLIAQ